MLRWSPFILLFCFVTFVLSVPVPLQSATMQTILDMHNRLRASQGIRPLQYNANINAFAQNRAEQLSLVCQLNHDGAAPYGENLALISGSSPDVATIASLVQAWINEPLDTPNHVTQMLWSDTTELGCAVSLGCGNTFLVCNYNPPGNVQGQTFNSNSGAIQMVPLASVPVQAMDSNIGTQRIPMVSSVFVSPAALPVAIPQTVTQQQQLVIATVLPAYQENPLVVSDTCTCQG